MNPTGPERLLLDALVFPLPAAREAWGKWRASAKLEHLDPASFHLLPALAGRMPEWLINDPQEPVLLGICRQTWCRNQVRRKLLADAIEILRSAGIDRVSATGSVLWGETYWPEGAIRTIDTVDVLVEPASARAALDALLRAGWIAKRALPDTSRNHFYFDPGVPVESPSGGEVRVNWRALPNTDFALRRPPGPELEALTPAHCLVAALGGEYQDAIGWQLDAFMICRSQELQWNDAATLLRRRSVARQRLEELSRDWGAPVPEDVTRLSTGPVEQALIGALRGYRRRKRELLWSKRQ
jgi:hypothetical protein